MNENQSYAIMLTRIGLGFGHEYEHKHESVSIAVYPIISVDGSSFFVVFSDNNQVISKKEFNNVYNASHAFATAVWKLMGIE